VAPLLRAVAHSRAFHGALVGWLVAARVDYKAFRQFKSINDAKQYNWRVAGWNWLEGIVAGAVAGGGWTELLGS
jgi:hypothetical protein